MSQTTLDDLSTPAFIVNHQRLERNTRRMREKAERSGVRFRPHVKTHKTAEIARMQHGGKSGPITVSTLAEAEFMLDSGFDDITYAVPISPDKLARVARLSKRARQLNLLVDHQDALQAIESFCTAETISSDVFLKVDCGDHRAGVDPEDPDSLELARRMISSKVIRFQGVLTHAGQAYQARKRDEILQIAVHEADVLSTFVKWIGSTEKLCRSIGSTPTAAVVERFPDADEVRPGNYVFFDAFQAAIGTCEIDDCAAAVASTVIGVYPDQNKVIVDAGALALSKDAGPVHVDPDCGFGVVADLQWRPTGMKLRSLSQEHGQVYAPSSTALPPIGTRLLIIPNHSCLTAALFDQFYVVEGDAVVESWRPVRGW